MGWGFFVGEKCRAKRIHTVGAIYVTVKKLSLFNVQLSFVICGGASRHCFFLMPRPKAHPQMTIEH